MNRALRLAVLLTLLLASVFYGMASYSVEPPPGRPPDHSQRTRTPAPARAAAQFPSPPAPPALAAGDAEDAVRLRSDLIAVLWGDSVLPSRLPDAVERDQQVARFSGWSGVSRLDLLVIRMDFGLRSTAYHFIPAEPNGRVVLYHAGHGQLLADAKLLIERLAQEGYAVVGFEMPLEGINGDEGHTIEAGGVVLGSHEDFVRLRPDRGHPMRYFIEPVVVALNYLEQQYDYDDAAMIGLSGGGWTTTLAAAVDPRIRLSFPVAGSLPRYLRLKETDQGDWEQQVPAVYDVAGYRDLYILGAYGIGRKQIQILNVYDPCCFDGLGWQTYANEVASAVRRLGAGEFHLFADDTHRQHVISSVAMTHILRQLAQ